MSPTCFGQHQPIKRIKGKCPQLCRIEISKLHICIYVRYIKLCNKIVLRNEICKNVHILLPRLQCPDQMYTFYCQDCSVQTKCAHFIAKTVVSRPNVRPTLLVQSELEASSPAVKQPECETNHSSSFTTKIKDV